MVDYDARTALIVNDVQNDFADPSGALYVPGAEGTVTTINDQIRQATAAGALVVYTQDWHPPITPHFAKDGGRWPVHCVRDTWGAQLVPGLERSGPVVRKGVGGEDGYSGFTVRHPETGRTSSTGLAELLRERGIAQVVIVGLATDYCIKDTALDALAAGFGAMVLGDCVRAIDREPGDGARALDEVERGGGHVVTA